MASQYSTQACVTPGTFGSVEMEVPDDVDVLGPLDVAPPLPFDGPAPSLSKRTLPPHPAISAAAQAPRNHRVDAVFKISLLSKRMFARAGRRLASGTVESRGLPLARTGRGGRPA